MKKVKLFVNNNIDSIEFSKILEQELLNNGFTIDDKDYSIAIAIGGDGSFLRMVKQNNFNSDIYYIGINTGTLGFLQEVRKSDYKDFIKELVNNEYRVEELGIQETIITHNNTTSRFLSLNEIVVRDKELNLVKLKVHINGDLLEDFTGDGLLIATSTGSTAYNLSFGGSIVYNAFNTLQITPIAPINSKVYRSLLNSVIIPSNMNITLSPKVDKRDLVITIDGENNFYNNVEKIETSIKDKTIKCIRLSHYNFPEKINDKLLN